MRHEAYLKSPYRYMNIEERIFTTKENEELTTNMDTGELFVIKRVSKDKKVMHDSLVYTKLFQDSVRQLCELSSPGVKVLLYGMAMVKPLSEVVILNGPDVMLFCNIGKTSFYDGITELLDKRILSKKLGSSIEFWFDPNIFFNGNRARLIK
jgi:hypothetical protein